MALSWLLDDGVIDLLARCPGAIRDALRQEDLAIAEATATDGSEERRQFFQEAHVKTLRIEMESVAEKLLYGHFRSRSEYQRGTVVNFAEHQAFALLLTEEQNRTFVTFDKGAAYLALLELGPGRVAHPVDLFWHLEQEQRLKPGAFGDLLEKSRKKEQLGPPWRLQLPNGKNLL